MYTLVGIRQVSFKGSDGSQVSGTNLFFTYPDPNVEGLATERVFVSAERLMKLDFIPKLGGECALVYNKYGKVANIVQA